MIILAPCRCGSFDWIIEIEGYRFFSKDRQGRKGEDVASMSLATWSEWSSLCLRVDEKLNENLLRREQAKVTSY